MRSRPTSYFMSFLLPGGVTADSGLHAPSDDGCELFVVGGTYVEILGPSREAIFEHATRLLRVVCQGKGARSISTTVESPLPNSGRDNWTIVVNADVSFIPSSLGATFPSARPPPVLVAIEGGRRRLDISA